ncbi:hypothetical protein MYX84_10810, partial [Acidobacteria bacterium AH-259-O06]|nr:hypothetical protein [Acidobacteria bacterium AH-259-O06]
FVRASHRLAPTGPPLRRFATSRCEKCGLTATRVTPRLQKWGETEDHPAHRSYHFCDESSSTVWQTTAKIERGQ